MSDKLQFVVAGDQFAKEIDKLKFAGQESIKLEHSEQYQNQNYDQNQANAAAWSIAPIAAVRPAGDRAQQQKHQQNQ
jgi:hypothetical protein